MGQYGLEVHVAFNDWHKEVSMRVSLTFDDGPNTVTSPRLLDVLEKYNTRASFFLIGNNIHDDCLPVMERQLKDGCSIECHSWSHPAFPDLTAEQMLKEIDDTNSLIEKNLGWKTKFFRPPYIALNQLMYDTIKMPFICGRGVEDWNMDIPAEVKAKGVIDNVKDGQIILLHDMTGNQTTVDAVDIIIPTLLERGVEQMLKEIDDTNSLIEKNLGWKTKFFRPPYIALNQLMYDTIKMPFICGRGVEDWNMDIPAEVKAKGVIDNVKDGQIILLHDMTGNQTTVDAVDIIIPTLLERGVEFYNVRELFDVCNVNPFKANTIWTDVLED